jgi:four helix bundle protein
MQDFRKLRVWEEAQGLCVAIYRFFAEFPLKERYGVTSQLRRAAVSVGSNIAEGCRRASATDKARVMNIAESEGGEVVSLLDISDRLQLGPRTRGRELIRRYEVLGAQIEALRQRVLEGR